MMNRDRASYGYRWFGTVKDRLGWAGILSLILLIGGMGCGQSDSTADLGTPNGEIAPDGVVRAVKVAIASETGIAVEQLSVTAASAETWPDGCLGLGDDDELCTQALVSGWQMTIEADIEADDEDRTWTYRTDNTGDQLRLAPES